MAFFTVSVLFGGGCSQPSEPRYISGDADSDSDVDGDADSDTDADSDADGDTGLVGQHGLLQVSGSELHDAHGNLIVLEGLSLFWSQWGQKYYNADVISYLARDWGIDMIRAALAIDGTDSGYLVNPDVEKAKIETVVNAAIDAGIYVIIDWHDHDAHLHQSQAQAFFSEMAQKYGHYDNIIYEIWNEPLSVKWQDVIKPYAEAVIGSIRVHDPDNLVVVGTRNWSQNVDDVIGNEIADNNVAYSLHYYVGLHTSLVTNLGNKAIAAGLPLFVSEWGIWTDGYVGSSRVNPVDEAKVYGDWLNWVEENNLSHAYWSVNDKLENSSLLKTNANTAGEWTWDELTTAGQFMHGRFH